jgi:large subunit ribosomal protein L28
MQSKHQRVARRPLCLRRRIALSPDALGRNVRRCVPTKAIKSVDHRGGFDAFMLKAKASELSPRALDLKRAIEKTAKVEPEAKAS